MKRIITVGGGTGSYTVLSGLKNIPGISISALVAMSDNGGSTGTLRDELGVLPPGDVRQCLVALSEHTDIVRKLMNYRFNEGGLEGHSFGNLFLAALEKVTGDFTAGVEIASEILKVKGHVIPITRNNAELCIEAENGEIINGQIEVTSANIEKRGFKRIFFKEPVKLNENAQKAILEADYILIGPGGYYISILANLIVDGFKEEIAKTKAKIILPVNLTNANGHTWKASTYLHNIETYLERKVDIILINNERPTKEQIERYELKEGDGVLIEDDLDDARVVRQSLISPILTSYDKSDTRAVFKSFIRHDSDKIAQAIAKIIS